MKVPNKCPFLLEEARLREREALTSKEVEAWGFATHDRNFDINLDESDILIHH